MPKAPAHTDAWMFVLQHAAAIDWATRRRCPKGTAFEDFRQDLVVRVVENHHNFDSRRASAATWVWWQAFAIRTRIFRRIRQKEQVAEVCRNAEDYRSAMRNDALTMDQRVEVSRLVQAAGVKQLEAMDTILLGVSKADVPDHLGCTRQARDNRLRRYGARFDYHAA